MRVQLTRKLAKSLDGVDLSGAGVGNVLDVSARDGELLVAEGRAVEVEGGSVQSKMRATAANAVQKLRENKRV